MQETFDKAWDARGYAQPRQGGTSVGCVVKNLDGQEYTGQNVVGPFGLNLHAEVCTIAKTFEDRKMIASVFIVADVSSFTPCGACMDWLMHFSKDPSRTKVYFQNKDMRDKKEHQSFTLDELMPHYPKY